ncbi:MAG: diguanylate cyclase, partial [Desulfobacterales bacterium]|nr:diguanylate cyclase [Desulfobacterales bacterium]
KISGKLNKVLELSIGTRKDEPQLRDIFNKAIATLTPADHRRILNQWVVIGAGETGGNDLTPGEKNFIKQHPVIRFRIRPDRPPFELVRNGKAAGLAVDYLSAIAEIAGFTPEFIVNDMPVRAAYDTVAGDRAEFDTLAFSVKSKERAKRFTFGDAFLSYPMMIITHKEAPYIGKTSDLQNKRVAVEKGFLTNKWLKRDYPEIHIVPADTTKTALQMVNDKKVDAYVGNIAVANYMMTHGDMRQLKIVAPSDYGNIDYSFIAPREWPELITVLNKGYRSLPADFHTLTQQKWFSVQVVERIDYRLLWQAVGGAGLVVAWILWWNRKLFAQKEKTEKALGQLQAAQVELKEKNEMLEKLSITDQLTSLYNRLKLDTVLEEEFQRSKRYGNVFGVIMTDIDRFKQVNDTHGHQVGDKVLTGFADLLVGTVRTVDTVGRWGGEEFLIICPETDRDGLLHLAENLRRVIAAHSFDTVGQVTASFGVTLYDGHPTVDAMISRADEALYLSKENGRNRVTLKS